MLFYRCREGKCKWWISSKDLAEELGLRGKNKHIWVCHLLARLRQLKLIDWHRGRNRVSEYWILPFPNPEWLSAQIGKSELIRKPNIGLSDFELASKLSGDLASRLIQNPQHAGLSTGCEEKRSIIKEVPSSPTPSPLPASRRTQNGRKNGTPKHEPVPVFRNHLGRCAYCGAHPINERYCVCAQAIAAYEHEHRNHTGLKQ